MEGPGFKRIGTILIHGASGLIGGSLGMAVKRYGLADRVIGCGRSVERLQVAANLGACDSFSPDGELPEACAQADVIVLCTPVSQIIRDLPNMLNWAREDAVVTDVGSVKGAIVDAALGDPRFVGSHPMAGSEVAGVEAARASLFQEATWALTPVESTNPLALDTVTNLAHGIGAVTRVLTPELHDEAVAVTSHLPHVLASALMALADGRSMDNADISFMSAGSFADATRVAASSPTLWRDICANNRPAISSALAEYRQELELFQAAVDSGDADEIEALFARGARAKRAWAKQ